MKLLPESLFVALECCLEDEHVEVRRAAAITLFVLERPTEHVRPIHCYRAPFIPTFLIFLCGCDRDLVQQLVKN